MGMDWTGWEVPSWITLEELFEAGRHTGRWPGEPLSKSCGDPDCELCHGRDNWEWAAENAVG